MKEDFLDELSSKQKEAFFNSVVETMQLLKLKELEHFSLSIDYEDPECQDFIIKTQHFSPDKREKAILKQGSSIIQKYFKYQKKKELTELLEIVHEKYNKKDKKMSKAAFTALLLLEDKAYDYTKLPFLSALLSVELTIMEEELFNDPTYFSRRGMHNLENEQLEEAEKFFLLERKIDDRHWSSYENLAEIYYKKGEKQKAAEQIQEALERIYRCWREEPHYLDFEVIEEVEEKAGKILNRNKNSYIHRLSQYVYGLLYFLGAAPLDIIVKEVKDLTNCKTPFSEKELLHELKKDNRLAIEGDLVYLQEIENPHLIIQETKRRNLKQLSLYSLSALKLVEEGRIREFFFSYDADAEDVDNELKDFTGGELDLVKVYEELRKDVVGRKHHDLLINKIIQSGNPYIHEILELFNYIWNCFPRWEIGGRTTNELSEKRKDDGFLPDLHTHLTSFAPPQHNLSQTKKKTGRNEPCPCGSRKKYKKCCGR